MAFVQPVDIANRALQHVGARRITALGDNAKAAGEVNFCYDKLRRAELRRSPWRFATRRAILRPLTKTMYRFRPGLWNIATPYFAGSVVVDGAGTYWLSVISNGNVGQIPGVARLDGGPPYWQQYFGPIWCDAWSQSNAPYNSGELVYQSGSSQVIYKCDWNNISTTPSTDPANWAYQILGNLDQVITFEPFGPDITVNTVARNAFPLPHGYMRLAAPDPKVAARENLVTTAGLRQLDWQFENSFIVSAEPTSLLLRYIADVSDVTAMDDMFCEMLAARIAYEICEPLTQSASKLDHIGAAYQKFANEARLINWLETGSTELAEEQFALERANELGVGEKK